MKVEHRLSLFMKTTPEQNKNLVLDAFDTLFNKRNYAVAEKFWSPKYIQHSAHIEPGRDGLFNLVKNLPATLKWAHGVILAEDDFVIVHSRYSGHGLPAPCLKVGAMFFILWKTATFPGPVIALFKKCI